MSKNDSKNEATQSNNAEPKRRGAPRGHRSGTKRAEVLRLLSLKSNRSKSRKDQIKLVMDKMGMTEAGAATYVSNIRKDLGLAQPRVKEGEKQSASA